AFSLRQFFAGFNEIVDDGYAHPWILGVMRFEKSVQFTCALVGLSTPATHARRRALVALCAMFFENRFTRDRERWTWPQQKGALTSPSNRSVELAPTSICTLSKVTDQP
ncbi:MAG: hypothetical protein ACXWKB_08285, partial [Methyloceanibacter sp.]